MKKIIIIGCPGSGKSTFARKLQKVTGIPLYYLDMLFWNSDRTSVSKEMFRERLSTVMKKDSWIIDGNYLSTMEWRISECDTVFFLDYSTTVCVEGIKSRVGQLREDMPWIEEAVDDEFLEFVKKYNVEIRPRVLALLEKYKDKRIIVFADREKAESFLAERNKIKSQQH